VAKFQKGHSGNLAGRPPGSGRNEKCRLWAERYGIAFLMRVASGKECETVVIPARARKDGKVGQPKTVKRPINMELRVRAAQDLLDRGLGRAPQTHDVKGDALPVWFTLDTGGDAERATDAD